MGTIVQEMLFANGCLTCAVLEKANIKAAQNSAHRNNRVKGIADDARPDGAAGGFWRLLDGHNTGDMINEWEFIDDGLVFQIVNQRF